MRDKCRKTRGAAEHSLLSGGRSFFFFEAAPFLHRHRATRLCGETPPANHRLEKNISPIATNANTRYAAHRSFLPVFQARCKHKHAEGALRPFERHAMHKNTHKITATSSKHFSLDSAHPIKQGGGNGEQMFLIFSTK